MNDKIFLASYDKGITRAQCDAHGDWRVQHLAADHRVTRLAAHPRDRNVVFAATRDGVLRSDDCGFTWRDGGMQGHIVKSIAVSPHDPDQIFAGTKPAYLHVSRDGGQSWRELEGFGRIRNRWWWFSPAEPPDMRAYVIDVAVSPTEPDVLLAGIEFGAVVRSEDGGQTWSPHRRGALRDCHSLKFHVGEPWQPIGWQPHPLPIPPTALVTIPGQPGSLLAGLRNGDLWRSTDYGDTWQQLPFNLQGIWFSLLVI